MIKSIKLENFFSFRDAKIDFNSDINILVGINGSGKSNLLKAIRFLKEGVNGIGLKKLILDHWGGFDAMFFCGIPHSGPIPSIVLEFVLDSRIVKNYGFRFREDIHYKIEIIQSPGISNFYIQEKIYLERPPNTPFLPYIYLDFFNGKGVLNERKTVPDHDDSGVVKTSLVNYDNYDPQELALSKIFDSDRFFALDTIRKAIGEIDVYDYFDTTPFSKIRKPMLPTSGKKLLPDGTNLPQLLSTIKINDKQTFKKLIKSLTVVNDNFKGIDFNFIGGNIELMLEENALNKAIHVTHISDGTLRFLCLLSILLNSNRGKFICIDEPEVGLHPDMILNIANAANEAATDSCLLISTHSDALLNHFKIENVKVCEKDENNSSRITAYSEKDFEGWYQEFSVGEMWRKGDIGGNRW